MPSTASEGEEEQDFVLEEQANPEVQWSPAMLFLANAVKTLVTPVLKFVFAPKAQKTLIRTTAIVLVFLWIMLTSVAAYLTFYRQYVPRTAHIEPIYFQYTAEEPIAVIDLARGQTYAVIFLLGIDKRSALMHSLVTNSLCAMTRPMTFLCICMSRPLTSILTWATLWSRPGFKPPI